MHISISIIYLNSYIGDCEIINAAIPICQYPGNNPNISGLIISETIIYSAIIVRSNNSKDL